MLRRLGDSEGFLASCWVRSHEKFQLATDTVCGTVQAVQTLPFLAVNRAVYSDPLLDNANQSIDVTLLCGQCPDHDFVWRILRWLKLIALKMARDYYAFPLILILIPLLAGLVIGFWIGQRCERRSRSTAVQQGSKNFSLWSLLVRSICTYVIAPIRLIPLFYQIGNSRLSAESEFISPDTAGPSFGKLQSSPAFPTKYQSPPLSFPTNEEEMAKREETTREGLLSSQGELIESGVPPELLPRHIAVIMDGNRRYGKAVYGSSTAGHWDGSRKLVEFAKWCRAEGIQVLTVFALSTENWNREPAEIAALMEIFTKYCEELRVEAVQRRIRVRVLSTETRRIPLHVQAGLDRLQKDTLHLHGGLEMNICLSYGSRSEIVQACQNLSRKCVHGDTKVDDITEEMLGQELLTNHNSDPDILLRTSGEMRISNFLLWQLAYAEMFFVDKHWPELEKNDLLRVIRDYANGRKRRFGK